MSYDDMAAAIALATKHAVDKHEAQITAVQQSVAAYEDKQFMQHVTKDLCKALALPPELVMTAPDPAIGCGKSSALTMKTLLESFDKILKEEVYPKFLPIPEGFAEFVKKPMDKVGEFKLFKFPIIKAVTPKSVGLYTNATEPKLPTTKGPQPEDFE